MDVKIISKEQKTLVGIHITCPFSAMGSEIPRNWVILKDRLNEIKNRVNNNEIVGFYPQESDEPNPNKCHYYLCVEVEDIMDIPVGMISIVIPKQKYVSHIYKGPLDRFVGAYEVVNKYIEEQKLEHNRKTYVLEVKQISNDPMDRKRAENQIELMIPIH